MNKQILVSVMISALLPLSVLSHPGDGERPTLSLRERLLRHAGRTLDGRLSNKSLLKGLIRKDSHLMLMVRTGANCEQIEEHLLNHPRDIYHTNLLGETAESLIREQSLQIVNKLFDPFEDEKHVSKVGESTLEELTIPMLQEIQRRKNRDSYVQEYHKNRYDRLVKQAKEKNSLT